MPRAAPAAGLSDCRPAPGQRLSGRAAGRAHEARGGGALPREGRAWAFTGSDGTFRSSEAHPARCLECMGRDLRRSSAGPTPSGPRDPGEPLRDRPYRRRI